MTRPLPITVKISNPRTMDEDLERAELSIRSRIAPELPKGVLITRINPTTFVVAASLIVPYGETHARCLQNA